MGRFISIGHTGQTSTPFVWIPRRSEPRFVKVAAPELMLVPSSLQAPPVDDLIAPPVDAMAVSMYTSEPIAIVENVSLPESSPAPTSTLPSTSTLPPPAPVEPSSLRAPLSQNLLSIRRLLNLTPEEFARPIIEDGEGLINRLEAGFSRPSVEISNMICDTWGICSDFLFKGTGSMFLKDDTESTEKYVILLIKLLKTYLSVATFDRKGKQYWKGSLVDDLTRLIDVAKLNGRGMSRVVRVLYDHLDVDQFADLLERFGR